MCFLIPQKENNYNQCLLWILYWSTRKQCYIRYREEMLYHVHLHVLRYANLVFRLYCDTCSFTLCIVKHKSSLFTVFISTTTMQVLDLHKGIWSMPLKGMSQVKNKLHSVDTIWTCLSKITCTVMDLQWKSMG